ncbi:MAG: RHS repeat-associated core domain-containing protein [Terriglobales bacterium]
MPSGYGFTNQGKTVRFASFERDKRNQVTAATVWDASTADLKAVVSKGTIHFDPIGFPGPVVGTGDVVWNQAHGKFDEYDLATGRKIRTLPSPGDLAESYPLGDGLLVAAQQSVPSRKDWGGYLLRYGASAEPIRSPMVAGCALLPQRFTADQRYAVALCDGTKLNTLFDSYYTAKLEAVTFDLKTMAILAEVPLNRRYEHTSLAIATDAEGILEAVSDHAGEVQILRIPVPTTAPATHLTAGLMYDAPQHDFGARYYASTLGRFLTPDWSATPEATPYANLSNPQSLNLYSYVLNNPATAADPDGHDAGGDPAGGVPFPSLIASGACGIDGADNGCGAPSASGAGAVESLFNPFPAVSALVAAQNAARVEFAPDPLTGQTYCKLATCSIAESVGAPMGPLTGADGSPLLANQIALNLAHSADYREVSSAEAQALADQGRLVIGAWYNPGGHGRLVTVRPEGVPGDHPAGLHGPLVNDIGSSDQVARQSAAFRAADHVRYYTPAGGGGQ